jgi:hypothetical protein
VSAGTSCDSYRARGHDKTVTLRFGDSKTVLFGVTEWTLCSKNVELLSEHGIVVRLRPWNAHCLFLSCSLRVEVSLCFISCKFRGPCKRTSSASTPGGRSQNYPFHPLISAAAQTFHYCCSSGHSFVCRALMSVLTIAVRSSCANTSSGDLTGMCVVATLVAAVVDRPAFTPGLVLPIGCSSLVVIVRPCFSLSLSLARLHRLAKGEP